MTFTHRTVLALAALAILWPAAPGRSQGNLVGTEWRVAGIAGKPVTEAGTVRFEAGKVSGKAACNNYFGALKEAGQGIEISGIGATRKFCDGRMELEQALLKALGDSKLARLDGATLTLLDAAGAPVLALVR